MSRDDNCSSTIAILSFLTGTVIGAGIALLVTPKTGEETREMLVDYGYGIKSKVSELPDNLKERAEKATEHGRDMIERGKDLIHRGTDLVGQGKGYLEEKKETLSAAIEAGKKAMQEEKSRLSAEIEPEEE
jgi:gas vesicle protein